MENHKVNFIRLASESVSKDMEIKANKMHSRLSSQAAKNTKRDKCYFCEKPCTSFCNSHSIPKFALERVSENGKVFSFIDNSLHPSKESRGINNTGTFQIICNNCDSKIFHDYENPDGYNVSLSKAMLSQIAMKNYLHLIWKRTNENEFYRLLKKETNTPIADEKIFWGEFDLDIYSKEYMYAKKSLDKNNEAFYVCFYKRLDYVIPYAAQAAITLIGDLEDNLVNDLFSSDMNRKLSSIHFMALPLKDTSVLLAFIKNGDKRYRKFYKQLLKLPLEDQLSAVNYILFSNTENIFVNPSVAKKLLDDEVFLDICRKITDYTTDAYNYDVDPTKQAIKEFSISQRTLIPNLLAKEYSL